MAPEGYNPILMGMKGEGGCRLCGVFLDSQLERGESSSTAEATRSHCAFVHAVLGRLTLADLGVTTVPRGLTDTISKPADSFTTTALSPDAARPWMFA